MQIAVLLDRETLHSSISVMKIFNLVIIVNTLMPKNALKSFLFLSVTFNLLSFILGLIFTLWEDELPKQNTAADTPSRPSICSTVVEPHCEEQK